MARVSPVKTFNSNKRVRTANDSGLILPGQPEFKLNQIYDSAGNVGITGNPYAPGGARDQIHQAIGEAYLEHLDRTGAKPTNDARKYLGIVTDPSTGKHSLDTRRGLFKFIGTPLADIAEIPVGLKPSGEASTGYEQLAPEQQPSSRTQRFIRALKQKPGTDISSDATVQHWLNNSHETVGRHPLGFNLAPGHYHDPRDTSPEGVLSGSIVDTSRHIDTMHTLLVDALMRREVGRTDRTPENTGQGYMAAIKALSPLWEPKATYEGKKFTGWEPHAPGNPDAFLSRPVPLEFAINKTLHGIFHNPHSGVQLDPLRSQGADRAYDEHLIRSIPTARWAVDAAPVNMVNHLMDPNYMIRDYQHVIGAMSSSDKVLSDLTKSYFRGAKSSDGTTDFSGMTPLSSLTLGKNETGANRAVIDSLTKNVILSMAHGVKDIRNAPRLGREFDRSTADRVNRASSELSRLPRLDRTPSINTMNDEPGMFAYQDFY